MHSNDRISKSKDEGVSLLPSSLVAPSFVAPSYPVVIVPRGTARVSDRGHPTPQIVLREMDQGVPSARSGLNFAFSSAALYCRKESLRDQKIFPRKTVEEIFRRFPFQDSLFGIDGYPELYDTLVEGE